MHGTLIRRKGEMYPENRSGTNEMQDIGNRQTLRQTAIDRETAGGVIFRGNRGCLAWDPTHIYIPRIRRARVCKCPT